MKATPEDIKRWQEKGLKTVARGINTDRLIKEASQRPHDSSLPSIPYVIMGEVPSKSNSYRIGTKGLFKNKSVRLYEAAFIAQCKELNRNVEGEFELHMTVYYSTKRRDLDGSLKVILDCLQKGKVIKNDNRCVYLNIHKRVDKLHPRIEYKVVEKL